MIPIEPRIFTFGGLAPTGGGYMNLCASYALARNYGYQVSVVAAPGETIAASPFRISPSISTVSFDEFKNTAQSDDIVFCSPSFSHLWLGLTAPCKTIMYVQGFRTFQYLDVFFDKYFAVSDCCKIFLSGVYNIPSTVIPAFVDTPCQRDIPLWTERSPHLVYYYTKSADSAAATLIERFRRKAASRGLDISLNSLVPGPIEAQASIFGRLASTRYLLNLCPAEGFGLIPLEAMARGVIVAGVDGEGGRQYMAPPTNCLCRPMRLFDQSIDSLLEVMENPQNGPAISSAARVTAARYSRQAFGDTWVNSTRTLLARHGQTRSFE